MRVLVSAYAFSPYRGSESAVGWNICKSLARLCDVTVLCGDVAKEQEVKRDLERWTRENGSIGRLHIEYVEPNLLIRLIERLHRLPGLWALYYLAYNLWQRKAYSRALEMHREEPFDIAHQLTMIGYREPGYLWKLPIPFVWGPIGGGPDEPLPYWKIYSFSARINVVLRNLLNRLQKYMLIRPRKAAKRASKIWAVTESDERTIRDVWGADCERMIETAATALESARLREYKIGEPLNVVWSGTHTYGKAMPILIEALAVVKKNHPESRIRVYVLGKGSETERWKALAEIRGVADYLNWIGFVPRDQAIEIMNKAHVTAFTSLKEGTPHVVLESLALGIPVICHDACGMGVVVTENCGIKIPMRNPKVSIEGFSSALEDIICGKYNIREHSQAAILRARALTWQAKAEEIYSAYDRITRGGV